VGITDLPFDVKTNKNRTYLEFKAGDLVWLHLKKERFFLKKEEQAYAKGDTPTRLCTMWEIMATK